MESKAKKKNISITTSPEIYQLLEENFDNKSAVIEWFIREGLAHNSRFKKIIQSDANLNSHND